ncbi:MAG: 7TM diverse intracellular signaling domain-containing protein [Marinilabilia sp.]
MLFLSGCNDKNISGDHVSFQVENSRQEITVLDGKMAFYWNQLLKPTDFQSEDIPVMSALVDFPESWNNFEIDGKSLPGRGHATYRTCFVVDSVRPLALKVFDYCNAFRLWINGELVAQKGMPTTNAENNTAAKVNVVESFIPEKGMNELVLQTANYEEHYGGFRQALLIGEEAQIRLMASKEKTADAFVLGVILMMALYHLVLFVMNRERKAFLWFGLMAFFIALRQGLLSHLQIFDYWLQENVHLYLKLAISAAILTSVTLFFFFYSVYPLWLKRWIRDVYSIISIIFVLAAMLLPVYFVSVGIHFFQVFIIVGLSYIFYLTVKALPGSSRYKRMIGAGIILFLLATVLEVFIFNRAVYSGYTLHYGLVGFIIFQSFALSADFSATSRKNRELTVALDRYNKNLQIEVENKSREVIEAKERELLSVVMQKTGTDKLLKKIEEKLSRISYADVKENNEQISDVVKLIQNALNSDESEKYLLHFEKIYPGFFDALKTLHPALSPNELKLCAYLKMNLGYKEIAGFLHIEPESIRKAKTRMRKKMGLLSNRDIQDYLMNF